jgi:hypothetical protein
VCRANKHFPKRINGVVYCPFIFYLYVIILNIYEQLFVHYQPMKVIINNNNHLKAEGNWNLKEAMEAIQVHKRVKIFL